MINPSTFHDLVSGQRRGVTASLARGLLGVAELPYGLAVRWRNRSYDRRKRAIQQVAVPVVSVGNLTTGGTGKTPLVEWLARWYRTREIRVTIVSRGYGAQAGAKNDEALELERKLPDVPHLQNPDRVAAAQTAIEELECQLILLDDGFQHRRLHRDLDIVLIDAIEPFGFNHLLPRGLLREPLAGLRRADAIVLSRSDAVDRATREHIRDRATRFNNAAVWVEVAHCPTRLRSSTGAETPVTQFAGRRVAAFCGIGNPAGFRHTLEACQYEVAGFREFPDHYGYQREDIDALSSWVAGLEGVEAILCTQKDLVKLGVERLGPWPLWALNIGIAVTHGEKELVRLLESTVERVLSF